MSWLQDHGSHISSLQGKTWINPKIWTQDITGVNKSAYDLTGLGQFKEEASKNSNRHFGCPLSFCEFLNYSQQQLLFPNPEQRGNQGLTPDHQDMALLSLLSHPTDNNWALTMCQVLYKAPRSIVGQTWWTISSGPHLREELSTYILKPLPCRWVHIVLEADFQDKMSTPSQFW